MSDESDPDLSDEEVLEAPRPYAPIVSREQPIPQFVHRGLEYFRSLPTYSYQSSYYDGSEEGSWYWDEEKPTHIGLGTKFDGKLHLKTAITLWHLNHTRQYRVVESKGKRWHAVCKEAKDAEASSETGFKCVWEVRASLRKHDGKWEIRKWYDAHTCMGHRNDRGHANLSSSMVALCVRHQIENDVNYKPSAIAKDIENKFNVHISYKKAWYARRKAIELVFGGWESSFRELPTYMNEMQTMNPGTVVEWLHNERLSRGSNKVFKYVFWAFGHALDAFKECKPVLTVDGTHLRGRLRGKLLIAVGFDSSKKCLPVAFAIVDQETSHSWNWFMGLVRTHVARDNRKVCIISDRHPGIINAMSDSMWEGSYHRACLVHVRKNVLQKYPGKKIKKWVWLIGISTQKRKFMKRRRSLEAVSSEALRYLNDIEKSYWTLLYDNCRRWGETTTNMVECYNNVLKGARELPIRACVDATFWRTVESFIARTAEAQQCQTQLTPWAHQKVNDNDAKGRRHQVRGTNIIQGIYEVRTVNRGLGKGGNTQTVEYLKGKCTCGKWQMWRLPCSHAAAVVRERRDDMLGLVKKLYRKEVWLHQYRGVFYPLRHPDYWIAPPWTLQVSPAQLVPRSRGRYRKARIPNQMDVREPDQEKAPRRCKNCGGTGHDRRNCSTGQTS